MAVQAAAQHTAAGCGQTSPLRVGGGACVALVAAAERRAVPGLPATCVASSRVCDCSLASRTETETAAVGLADTPAGPYLRWAAAVRVAVSVHDKQRQWRGRRHCAVTRRYGLSDDCGQVASQPRTPLHTAALCCVEWRAVRGRRSRAHPLPSVHSVTCTVATIRERGVLAGDERPECCTTP